MAGSSFDDLGALAVVRICHDLAGPAGALANGLELLEADASLIGEVRDLLRASADSLGARLDFFRAVFGSANSRALRAGAAERVARAYLSRLGDAARRYELSAFPDTLADDPALWQAALTLVLIGADAIPFGGRISLSEADGLPQLHVAGRRARLGEATLAALSGTAADAHGVAAALLVSRAAAAGARVRGWQAEETCGVAIETDVSSTA